MNLFINSYVDKNPERNQELQMCIDRNRECEAIDKIYLIGNTLQPEFSKLFNIPFISRPTYRDFFNIINRLTQPNDINIIANSDIYFKELRYEDFVGLTHDTCFALSRWDVNVDGSATHYNNSGSQDTWIFRGAIRMVEGADFTQGIAGCDNKIAWCLEQAGYKVTNPSLSIKTYHLHLSGVRYYHPRHGKLMYRLPRPRTNVPIT